MTVMQQDIQYAIRALGLSGQPVCIHASLRSFGRVEGGAMSVVQAFLDEQCTILVPSFSWIFAVAPAPGQQPQRNGWNYDLHPHPVEGLSKIYTPATNEIDNEMGAIAATVVAMNGRVRGQHPLCSFSALGPCATELVSGQQPSDVYAPLAALARMQGFVLLMGVDLTSLTLLHLAEHVAGRKLFRRWANDMYGKPTSVEVGGCSNGFNSLRPYLRPVMQTTMVGNSEWKLLPAQDALQRAVPVIRDNPHITHCGNALCERCNDAVEGGPITE